MAHSQTRFTSSQHDALTSPREASLTFCRLECDHTDKLFLTEYKRSNRTKGLKILRCFPHCCPNHIERSYCGSSLHVIVQIPTTTLATANNGAIYKGKSSGESNILLFARFECCTESGLHVGDIVSAATMTRETQSEENPEGTWIPGLKERTSAMQHVTRSLPESSIVFQLNGKVYSRWYYEWESGANKAQRLMRHALKAYAFERCTIEEEPSLRVIGVVSSPEFTVISYRRAPTETGGSITTPIATSSLKNSPSNYISNDEGEKKKNTLPTGEGKRSRSFPQSGWIDTNFESTVPEEQDAKRSRRLPPPAAVPIIQPSPIPSPSPPSLADSAPSAIFEDRVLWEHKHVQSVTISKNLALIYWFIKWTPLECYQVFTEDLLRMINQQILNPIIGLPSVRLNCFTRILLEAIQKSSPISHHKTKTMSSELETLLRVVTQILVWFYSDGMRKWTQRFAQHHAPTALLNKANLRHVFLLYLNEMQELLTQQVLSHTPLRTLAIVAEEIIAAVYTHELYHPKRPMIRQLLGEHGFLGWQSFVAQMRDIYITVTLPHTPRIPSSVAFERWEQMWNKQWCLDVERSMWKANETSSNNRMNASTEKLSLMTILDTLTQLSKVQIVLQVHTRTLRLLSCNSFDVGNQESGMQLVLDGKERSFRCFPHGWSSGMVSGAMGDYMGTLCMDRSDRIIVYLEFFHWGRVAGEQSRHMRLRMECWHPQQLYVNGEVLETISSSSLTDEKLQQMKIAEKLQHMSSTSARSPLGTFRLIYN